MVDGGIGAVVVNGFTGELRADTRQLSRWPDGLLSATRHRTAAGLKQAGLQNQLQRRMHLFPLAFGGYLPTPLLIQRKLNLIQTAAQVLLSDIAKLEARQRSHRVTQRTQEKLALQRITVGRCAIQVIAHHVKVHVILR